MLAVLVLMIAAHANPSRKEHQHVRDPFSALSLTGVKVNPFDEARGKPLVLVFIGHDCPISNAYAPELKRIEKSYSSKLVFRWIYAEGELSQAQAKQHAHSYGYPSAMMIRDPFGTLSHKAGATVTPEVAVFDGRGKRVYLGRIDDQYLDFGKRQAQVHDHNLRDVIGAVLAHRQYRPAVTSATGCYIAVKTS